MGKYLVRRLRGRHLIGKIVEVEGYLGERDPASHAFRHRTPRNEVMFWAGGHLYVYFTYGMHFCSNVVAGPEGRGHAVLIRALEPCIGIGVMRRNRGLPDGKLTQLLSGPAKICQALEIARRENGTDLCGNEIWIASEPGHSSSAHVARSTRVGVTDGREQRWRFFFRENPFVSPGKPA
jgi:DNA-3-methyladenine glycosylase